MGKNQLIKEESIMRKIVVSVLCLALIVSSLAFSGSKVQAKTYGPEEFGLGFNVEEYVGIKFQKMSFTKKSNLMVTTDINMFQTKYTKRNIAKKSRCIH